MRLQTQTCQILASFFHTDSLPSSLASSQTRVSMNFILSYDWDYFAKYVRLTVNQQSPLDSGCVCPGPAL